MGLLKLAQAGFKGAGQHFAGGSGWTSFFGLNNRSKIDYSREVGDATHNSAVAACLGWIVDEWPQAPIYLEKRIGQRSSPLLDHPLIQLLNNPNPWYGHRVLWQATLPDLLLDGNAYWHILRDSYGIPGALYWMPTGTVEPRRINESDDTAWIDYFEYTVGGKVYRLEATDVVHIRIGADSANPRKGVGRLKPGLAEVYTDNEASATVNTLLRNRAQPGLTLSPKVLESKNGVEVRTFTAEQAREIEAKVQAKFTGDRRGATMVHTIPTDMQEFGAKLADLASREIRRIPEERICALFKIPPGVVKLGAGLDRNTMSNASKDEEQAWRHGIMPLQGIVGDAIGQQLLWQLEPQPQKFTVQFDTSEIGALQEDVSAKSERTRGEWKDDLITHDTAAARLGNPVDDARKGKYYSEVVSNRQPDTQPPTQVPIAP